MRTILLYLLVVSSAFCKEKIAIIDTGVFKNYKSKKLCKTGHKSFVKGSYQDFNGHGNSMFSIISTSVRDHQCVVILKVYDDVSGVIDPESISAAIEHAIRLDVKYINLSLTGDSPSESEKNSLNRAISKGIRLFIAAGNYSKNLNRVCNSYPACYFAGKNKNKLVHVVGSFNETYSNYGDNVVTNIVNGDNLGYPLSSGTSHSTALFLSYMLNGFKY